MATAKRDVKKAVTPRKKAAPKSKLPAKESRCIREFVKKDKFHPNSFRFTMEIPKKGGKPVHVLVGCPKFAYSKQVDKVLATEWLTDGWAREERRQCAIIKTGERAGLRGHLVVREKSGAKCPEKYAPWKSKAERK